MIAQRRGGVFVPERAGDAAQASTIAAGPNLRRIRHGRRSLHAMGEISFSALPPDFIPFMIV